MAIPAGRKLSSYEVTSHIGSGGMGEVYQARDSKLGRDVAIKVLPEQFARDPERLARFQREAKMLATLNHPNIAAIYGLEESGGTHYLVMELVPGQTLAERINTGAIPLDEALPIARQIAEAVEYAHDKSVIHRDLKPANIKVTSEGTVKVLDFGLAKALSDEVSEADMSNSPTLSLAATRQGVILGTAAYMSPEQARGKIVDRRADVWAFGAVLYEMLTGKHAFPGEDITEVLAAVVKSEPAFDALPAQTPPAIRNLLRRSLNKNIRSRLRDVGEARIAIEQVLAGDTGDVAPSAPATIAQGQPLWSRALPWSLAAVLALLAGLAFWSPWRAAPAPRAVTRFTIALQPGELLNPNTGGLAVSPDGSYIAYNATRNGGTRQLFLRPMASSEATLVSGADNSTGLFFSPDGQWIAFTAEGKLKKVPVSGGTPIVLSDIGPGTTGAWAPDGTIFFAADSSGQIMRVPATGGTPQIAATVELTPGQLGPRWFAVLPGGKSILYAAGGTNGAFSDDATIVEQSLSTGEKKTIVQGGTSPRYLSTGHLLYAQGGRLLAAPFDLRRLEITGAAVPILEDVWQGTAGYSAYGVSLDGSVAYINGAEAAGGVRPLKLSLIDRSGTARPLIEAPHRFLSPALSPDGRQLAVVNFDVTTTPDIWLVDMARGTFTKLTFGKSGDQAVAPVWTPDGKRVIYSALSGTTYKLMSKASDGSAAEDTLLSDSDALVPVSVSPDGRLLVFIRRKDFGPRNLWVLELDGEHKVRPLIENVFNKTQAQISPDGKWFAYTSDESSRRDIFVQPFPGLGGKWQISTAGGSDPRWSRDGRQMFYRSGQTMMAVDIESKTGFTAGKPRAMFDLSTTAVPGYTADYDVALDGQHFLMLKDERSQTSPLELRVILNWAEEVKRRAPAAAN